MAIRREKNSGGGGMCCVQTSLIIFNLVTLVGGVATLGIGAWLLHQSQYPSTVEIEIIEEISKQEGTPYNGEFQGISILLVALGSLVTFVSFLGCFGAFVNSRCLLLCYLASVTLILSLQLMVSVFAVIYRQPVKNSIRNDLLQYIKTQYRPGKPSGVAWDLVQQQFQCCGVDGYSDWFEANAWPGERNVPTSCCLFPQNSTDCGKTNEAMWNKNGCIGQIQLRILEQLHIFASAIITLVFLQLYGIIASTLLFYHAKSLHSEKSQQMQKSSSPYKSYGYERAGML